MLNRGDLNTFIRETRYGNRFKPISFRWFITHLELVIKETCPMAIDFKIFK